MTHDGSRHVRRSATILLAACAAISPADDKLEPRLTLRDAKHPASGTEIWQGTFRVWEDRTAKVGRVLELDVIVLPKLEPPGEPDPVFAISGGPGQNVATHTRGWARHWMRNKRDIVLLSQRGTGGDNRLQCDLLGSDDDLQGYLEPIFDVPSFRACLEKLQERRQL